MQQHIIHNSIKGVALLTLSCLCIACGSANQQDDNAKANTEANKDSNAAEFTDKELATVNNVLDAIEGVVQSETGEQIDLNMSDDGNGASFTMKGSEDGGFSMQGGENISLPDNLPDDVPIPDSITVKSVQSIDDNFNIMGVIEEDPITLEPILKPQIIANGWVESYRMDVPGQGYNVNYAKGDRILTYLVAKDEKNINTISIGTASSK